MMRSLPHLFRHSLFLVALAFLFGCSKAGTGGARDKDSIPAPGFRVVGYLHTQGNLLTEVGQVDLSRITHLNIAFENPDSSGAFHATDLAEAAKRVHQAHDKILVAIGGGGAPAYFHGLLEHDKQGLLIANLTQLAVQNNLDGIDVDLEGPLIDLHYESFVLALGTALHTKGKIMTAAIATVYTNQLSDRALSSFDFINIMSYDKTGPWDPSRPGPHAPYSMAVDDLNFWTSNRSIPKEKLNLGVPFYGYGFGAGAPQSISFGQIVLKYPQAVNDDQISFPGGGMLYYNGIATIKKKALLAWNKAGGIMIWELSQDAKGDNSLLSAITDVLQAQ